MRNFIFFFILILLASCQKPVTQSYIPNPKDYTGTWEYEVWAADSTIEMEIAKEYFGLILLNTGVDSVKGLFYSANAQQYGNVYDGNEDLIFLSIKDVSNVDKDINVWGKVVKDSLYITLKGSYRENTSAKAVMRLVNDSTLLWKVIAKEGEIYVPDSAILKREYEMEVIHDSSQGLIDTSLVQLKGKLSEYSVSCAESEEYGDDEPMGYVSLLKNGETISKIALPCYMSNRDFILSDVTATSKGFKFSIDYGHTHLRYKQIFVIEYINNDFYLVKTIDYRPNELVPYGNSRESENKLKEPITFSKVNIAKIMLDYSGISEDE